MLKLPECPMVAFNHLVAGKHKIRILWEVRGRPVRFGDLRRALVRANGGREVTPRILSRELKDLSAHGLVRRIEHPGVPPRVEYQLTRLGKEFLPIMKAICRWRTRWDAAVSTRAA